jgi:transcriptional regulator with XRE-family HTH domain
MTVVDVAKLMPAGAKLSLSTLRKIESGERKLDPVVLRELATRIGVPYRWFTVPDIGQAFLGAEGESLEDRVLALESALAAVLQEQRRSAAPPGAVRLRRPGEENG